MTSHSACIQLLLRHRGSFDNTFNNESCSTFDVDAVQRVSEQLLDFEIKTSDFGASH